MRNSRSGTLIGLVDELFANPILTARRAADRLGVSIPTALKAMGKMVEMDILEEMPPGPRKQRRFVADEVMAALDDEWR